jgi:hypothetical protein
VFNARLAQRYLAKTVSVYHAVSSLCVDGFNTSCMCVAVTALCGLRLFAVFSCTVDTAFCSLCSSPFRLLQALCRASFVQRPLSVALILASFIFIPLFVHPLDGTLFLGRVFLNFFSRRVISCAGQFPDYALYVRIFINDLLQPRGAIIIHLSFYLTDPKWCRPVPLAAAGAMLEARSTICILGALFVYLAMLYDLHVDKNRCRLVSAITTALLFPASPFQCACLSAAAYLHPSFPRTPETRTYAQVASPGAERISIATPVAPMETDPTPVAAGAHVVPPFPTGSDVPAGPALPTTPLGARPTIPSSIGCDRGGLQCLFRRHGALLLPSASASVVHHSYCWSGFHCSAASPICERFGGWPSYFVVSSSCVELHQRPTNN